MSNAGQTRKISEARRWASVVLNTALDAAGAGADIASDIADVLTSAANGIAGGQRAEDQTGEGEKSDVFHSAPELNPLVCGVNQELRGSQKLARARDPRRRDLKKSP